MSQTEQDEAACIRVDRRRWRKSSDDLLHPTNAHRDCQYIQLYNSNYNGTYLVEYSGNDIIVVTFNYRVGAFGFLAGEEVASGGALNAGLLDQRFFFEWVKQNIEQFGGDPDHVVLDGTSAGAGSLLHHLTAYGGRNDNLFHAGISDSLYTPFQPECSYYQYQYDAITDATGCASSPDTLACLRSLDSTTFNNANVGYPYPNRPIASNNTSAYTASAGVFPYGPCIDGDLIPESTNSLLAEGKFLKLPLLLGNDNDEGTILVPDASTSDDVDAFFADNYPLLTLDEVQSISSSEYAYLAGVPTPLHGPYFSLLANAYDESTFTCPSNNLASIYANGAVPVWNYRYAVLAPSNAAAGIGTPHTYQDIAYWGPGDADYTKFPTYDADNAAVLPLVRGYWTSFVKTYDPNAQAAPGAPTWGQYGSAQNRILFNNLGASMENVPADENARCAYWHDQLGPHLAQ